MNLSIRDGVGVDIREARSLAHRILECAYRVEASTTSLAISALASDLLPGWYEDWVAADAEEWHQLRLHALEALAGQLLAGGRFGEASAAAEAAIRAEPLRESARAALISVHLAEGNVVEASREYERYAKLLRAQLGVCPTSRLSELVADVAQRAL